MPWPGRPQPSKAAKQSCAPVAGMHGGAGTKFSVCRRRGRSLLIRRAGPPAFNRAHIAALPGQDNFAVTARERQSAPLRRTRTNIAGRNLRTMYRPFSSPLANHLCDRFFRVAPVEPSMTKKKRKTVTTLEPRDCRWPIGDPRQADFHFCGELQVSGQPYCREHLRLAFQPPRPRHQQPPLSSAVRQAA